MHKQIKYPVGLQTFSEIIEGGYCYVDKTEIIYTLVDSNKYVFLSRPRRFGKSMLMSTLEAYFRGRKELFKGLAIERLEKRWECYPVFRFDPSPANIDHPDKLLSLITRHLNQIEESYGLTSSSTLTGGRMAELIENAYKKFGEKVVILIDEYDKPILDCLHDKDTHEKLKAEFRGFYSVIKASDAFIQFAMLTGITRFSKMTIFSGLNNLEDISMLSAYNDICGITEKEFHRYFRQSIRNFAEMNEKTEAETWEEFKLMYGGYRFARKGEFIYNPFSVLSALKREELKSYWYSSGSSSFLVKLMTTHEYGLDRIEGEKSKESELCDINDLENDLIPLLYQTGYLTIKGYDPDYKEYVLEFPNKEVREAFDFLFSSFL